jgi:NodT family efflux transporter outer membrane factor (OMF) lipoprotein
LSSFVSGKLAAAPQSAPRHCSGQAARGRALTRVLGLAIACTLSACAVGPDYRPPGPAAPDEWHSLPETGVRVESPEAPSLAAWWTSLDDPTLNQLIERALAENKTARQALARVVEARARRGMVVADFLPTLGASAGASKTDSDSRSVSPDDSPSLSGNNDEIYTAGLDSAWELDLFGGKRRALEASTAQLAASEADLRDVLVTLLGDVALGYIDVRTAQSRLTFAERNLAAQGEVLSITRWRADAGLANVLDVEQAKTSYEQTRAQIPALESSLAQGMNRLAVLTGATPGALTEVLAERKPVPVAPLEIVAGVPADVLRRRPDIRGAERRLAAQTAQVGVATAALYPSLSLSGSINLQSLTASDVLDGFQTERFGVSLSLPIFRGGALRQNINAQNALVDAALASYEATVLAAYEEVENALTTWVNEQRRRAALVEAVGSARRASELALMQYNSGLVDFQTVLTADRQLITLEDSLALSDGEVTSNLVRLYKALGGGWSVFPRAGAAPSGG